MYGCTSYFAVTRNPFIFPFSILNLLTFSLDTNIQHFGLACTEKTLIAIPNLPSLRPHSFVVFLRYLPNKALIKIMMLAKTTALKWTNVNFERLNFGFCETLRFFADNLLVAAASKVVVVSLSADKMNIQKVVCKKIVKMCKKKIK